jgi:hypothetical protein
VHGLFRGGEKAVLWERFNSLLLLLLRHLQYLFGPADGGRRGRLLEAMDATMLATTDGLALWPLIFLCTKLVVCAACMLQRPSPPCGTVSVYIERVHVLMIVYDSFRSEFSKEL